MRILITGASGLLGLNLALEACQFHTVIGIVNQNKLSQQPFIIFQEDLLASDAVVRILDKTQPDWIIHCAAQANIDQSEKDPERTMQINAIVPEIFAVETARRNLRLLHISTDAVFDGQTGNYTEEDVPNPLGVYAHSKLEGEKRVLAANSNAVVARVNLFGWSISGQRSLAEVFINNLEKGRAVKGFVDVDFCPMLANDLAGVFLEILEKGLSGLYHAVGRSCTTKYLFGVALAKRFGFSEHLIEPISVTQAGLTARRSPHLILKTTKLSQMLGKPLPGWQEGLDRLYNQWQVGYRDQIRKMGMIENPQE